MISAGNDIIALRSVSKQHVNKERFYSKILCKAEQEFYHQQAFNKISFDNFIWLLWSIKEAAYKFLKRHNANLIFSPPKFTVRSIHFPASAGMKFINDHLENIDVGEEDFYTGRVAFEGAILYYRSVVHNEFISTVVNNTEDFSKIYWGVKTTNDSSSSDQSKEVRSFLLKKLNYFFPDDLIQIEKHPIGYPILLSKKEVISIPVSFSHHCNLIAYCFNYEFHK